MRRVLSAECISDNIRLTWNVNNIKIEHADGIIPITECAVQVPFCVQINEAVMVSIYREVPTVQRILKLLEPENERVELELVHRICPLIVFERARGERDDVLHGGQLSLVAWLKEHCADAANARVDRQREFPGVVGEINSRCRRYSLF